MDIKLLTVLALLALGASAIPVKAVFINTDLNGASPNYIISDDELLNTGAWSSIDAQAFFESINSCLKDVRIENKSAAQIIYDESVAAGVNPMVIAALTHKEQGLFGENACSDSALNWATGYGTERTDFTRQIRAAALQLKWYYDHPENYSYQLGQTTTTQDGVAVTPENLASAGQFVYNPVGGRYLGGDYNSGGVGLFLAIWRTLFGVNLPDGLFVRTRSNPTIYQIQGRQAVPIANKITLNSYSGKIGTAMVADSRLNLYATNSSPLKVAEGSLIRATDGTVFVKMNGELKPFRSKADFESVGYNQSNIREVPTSDEVIANENIGLPIDRNGKAFPDNALVQVAGDPGVWLISGGKKKPFLSETILDVWKRGKFIQVISQTDLDEYEQGWPVLYTTGTLLKNGDTSEVYYVGLDNALHLISSEDRFNSFGFNSRAIITESSDTGFFGDIQRIGEAL